MVANGANATVITDGQQPVADPDRLSVLSQDLAEARRLLGEREDEIARLRAAEDNYARTIEERDALVAAANEARAMADARMTQLAAQVDALATSQQMLLKERQALDDAKDALARESWGLRDKAEQAAHGIERADREKQALQQTLARSETLAGELRNDLKRVTDSMSKHAKSLAALQAERDALAETKTALEAQVKQSDNALADRNAKIDALSQDLQSRKKKLIAQTAEQGATADQLKAARKELAQAREQLTKREAEASLATIKSNDLEKRSAQLKAATELLSEARAENTRLKKRRATLSSEVTRQNDELGQLQLEILRLEQVITEGQEALASARDGEAQALARIAAQDAELASLKGQLGQTQSALAQRQLETEQTADALRQAMADAKAQKEDMAARQTRFDADSKAYGEKVIALERSLADGRSTINKLQATKEDLAGRIDGAREEMSRLVELLLRTAAPSFLPKSLRLKQQGKLLDKFALLDSGWYLESNRDVLESGADPKAHFLEFGLDEGRAPNASIDKLKINPHA